MSDATVNETEDALEKYARFLKRTREMGVVGHRGGLAATRRLLELCELQPGQLVLEVGCGSGYTAATIAKESGVRVVAGDRERHLLLRTAQRARSTKVAEGVAPVQLDVEHLPFADGGFDGVICESVLGFLADRSRAVWELGRVVKPGGFLANNEVTFLQPPPAEFRAALAAAAPRSGGVLVVPVEPDEHRRLFEAAGFAPLTVETGDASTRQQTLDQMQIDGLRALKPMFASMFDRELRSAVYRRAMAEVQRTFEECTAYGLYFGRKSG
jgi:ubiquinone/menaquinone biosynthesis C-methylase UbiE